MEFTDVINDDVTQLVLKDVFIIEEQLFFIVHIFYSFVRNGGGGGGGAFDAPPSPSPGTTKKPSLNRVKNIADQLTPTPTPLFKCSCTFYCARILRLL